MAARAALVREVEECEELGALLVARRAPEGVNRLRELVVPDKCREFGGGGGTARR